MEEKNISVPEDYLRKIEKKVEDLGILMEVSALISSTLDYDVLMPVVMEKAKDIMGAEACSILIYNKHTGKLGFEVALCRETSASGILKENITLSIGQGVAGWVAEKREPALIKDVKKDPRFFCEADQQTGFTTRSLMAVPLIGRSGLIGVAEIMNPKAKDFFDEYDLEIFLALCRQVSVAIENSLFHKESMERERLRQELEFAAAIQRSFLPESPVYKKGCITASALNISARQVGGDLYDFVEPAPGKAGIFIGDISGKGISAALFMAKVISDFRYISRLAESPDIVLNRLNAVIANAPRGMFLTAIYLIADIHSGDIKISAAGHPPFFLISGGRLRVMDVQAGPPLGILELDYPVTSFSLKRGDRLVLLTDGVFDAKDREGRRIGFGSLQGFVEEHAGEEQLLRKITDYIDHFARGAEQADDLTLMELNFTG